jgi:hypothetical protein
MARDYLTTYLNDHLAGSVAALEVLGYLARAHHGKPEFSFFAELRADVSADRDDLRSIMNRLHVTESRPRKLTGWLTEKITQLKLRFDDPLEGSLRLLEAIEAVALGIEGKLALWQALAAAAEVAPELQGLDYERLARRAKDQRARIETVRLRAAQKALTRVTPRS